MIYNISVIIPTYNYAQYICRAVNSILTQNYPTNYIEIIVVDDGSVDNTNEVLQEFIDQGKVRYFFQENMGKAAATAKAIEEANGDIIFNLDADDYFLPNKLTSTINLFEQYSDLVHVASPAIMQYADSEITSVEQIPDVILDRKLMGDFLLDFFYQNNILFGGGSTFAAKSNVLKNLDIPSEVDMYIDEFLLLATLPFGGSYIVEKPLSVWYVHNKNYSVGLQNKNNIEKNKRLQNASIAVLKFVRGSSLKTSIKNIYLLKHNIRELIIKESINEKSLMDIIRYIKFIAVETNFSFKVLKAYSAFNRILPTSIIKFLK